MKFRLVTPEYPPLLAGISVWSAAMAGALREAGHEVIVHARAPAAGKGVIPMWGRAWNRWGGLWSALSVRPRLADDEVLLAARWDLARLLPDRAPVAVAWHGSDLTRPASAPGREAVATKAVNLPVSAYLGGLLGRPHRVQPFPLPPAPILPAGGKLLVVARLVASKGVDRALRLADRLGRDAIVVGDGPERAHLEALASSLRVRVNFLGATRNVPWHEAWALALLSRPFPDGTGQEGLGIVLLEAGARGIPSIGSRCGGIPEAASLVLDDPDEQTPERLPDREAVQAATRARHSPEFAVRVLLDAIGSR